MKEALKSLLIQHLLFLHQMCSTQSKLVMQQVSIYMYVHCIDLLTINNPYFIEAIPYIYPKELVLKRTTEKPDMVSYFISIMNKKIVHQFMIREIVLAFILSIIHS